MDNFGNRLHRWIEGVRGLILLLILNTTILNPYLRAKEMLLANILPQFTFGWIQTHELHFSREMFWPMCPSINLKTDEIYFINTSWFECSKLIFNWPGVKTCWINQFPVKQHLAQTVLGWDITWKLLVLPVCVRISILLRAMRLVSYLYNPTDGTTHAGVHIR